MKTLSTLAAVLVLSSVSAQAAEPAVPRAPGIEAADYIWNAPDAEKTRALQHAADADKGKIAYEVCQGCHREDGSGRADAVYPSLAGQHASVLIKQMIDVRAGRRDNPKMHPFVGDWVVSVEEVADIAAYLNQLPVPTDNSRGDGKELAQGKMLYERDCKVCHGANGEGRAADFYPLVAQQHYAYLVREGQLIRNGERRNANPKMVVVIRDYTDDELRAVSDYMSRLVLPAANAAPAEAGATQPPADFTGS